MNESLSEDAFEMFYSFHWVHGENLVVSAASSRRREPLFEIEMWNVRNRRNEDLARATNSLEGRH